MTIDHAHWKLGLGKLSKICIWWIQWFWWLGWFWWIGWFLVNLVIPVNLVNLMILVNLLILANLMILVILVIPVNMADNFAHEYDDDDSLWRCLCWLWADRYIKLSFCCGLNPLNSISTIYKYNTWTPSTYRAQLGGLNPLNLLCSTPSTSSMVLLSFEPPQPAAQNSI